MPIYQAHIQYIYGNNNNRQKSHKHISAVTILNVWKNEDQTVIFRKSVILSESLSCVQKVGNIIRKPAILSVNLLNYQKIFQIIRKPIKLSESLSY